MNFTDNDIAPVKLDGKWGFIDRKGAFVVPPQFDEITYENNGLYGYLQSDKVGYLNLEGQIQIPAQYDTLTGYSLLDQIAYEFYDDGYTIVRIGEYFGVINSQGQYILQPRYNGIGDCYNRDY